MPFDDDVRVARAAGGSFDGEIADGWWTPRGPLGGYVQAIVLNAMQQAVGDPARQPRSMTMHFLRPPQLGPVQVHPTVERAGRTLSTVTARLTQGDKLLGLALAAFSTPWESPVYDTTQRPEAAPPEGREPPPDLSSSTQRPAFTDWMTMQPRFGEPPFSRAAEAVTGGWLGLREERPIDALSVILLADAWFPAPWLRLGELAQAPTVDLTVHFRAPLPRPDGLLLGRFANRLVRDGFFEEDGELWSEDGTLVAQSRQLGILIGATG